MVNTRKVYINVVEGKDRRPLSFEYNGRRYEVESVLLGSLDCTPGGNMGFKNVCKVKGQKKQSVLWLDDVGDPDKNWFVEIE